MSKQWFTQSTGNHQGLIVDMETGNNIAVCYDKEDAPLMAASPVMLKALERIAKWSIGKSLPEIQGILCDVHEAIAKATGEPL